jgi:hypothetical protein
MRGWVSLDDTEELDVTVDELDETEEELTLDDTVELDVTVDELDETEEELTIDDEVGAIELVG